MHSTVTNPVQKIKEIEEEANKILADVRERARKDYAELVKEKESELEKAKEDTLGQVEEKINNLRFELDKKSGETEINIRTKAKQVAENSRSNIDKASNLIINRLVSE